MSLNKAKLESILDSIKNRTDFVIFGAQVIAYGAHCAIKELTDRKPLCFAVGKRDGNPKAIDNVSVRLIDEIPKDLLIIVAVTELVQKEVLPELEEKGFQNVFPLTASEEHLLMSSYYQKIGKFPIIDARSKEIDHDYLMYEIRNDRDILLFEPPILQPYECPIQAGAALSEKSGILTDDIGDNISEKNRQYCEMTVVFWIWKNRHHDFVGIEHYRRHLFVEPTMLSDDIDAILPLPYMCYPNERAQFSRFVSDAVIEALLNALRFLHPNEYAEYEAILNGPYQYTYNLMCVRWDVFNDYCKWFFEITEYLEQMSTDVPEFADTRALSYVAEVLTNIYFMSHKEYRIMHTEKRIYT